MGSFDKHPASYGGQGPQGIVRDSWARGLNCSQSHECNSPNTSSDVRESFDLSVTNHISATGPLEFKAKKSQPLKTILEQAEQTLRAACAAARHLPPEHTEGQHGTHGMRLAHTGYLSRDGAGLTLSLQWSAFGKRHSLSISPKSSWEAQCQFYLEKARLQGLFSPLC